jgi:hypothetical protein
VQYNGLFDTGGDRIAHVDVDQHSISFLYREAVKKLIPIGEVEKIYANKRQSMQLVLVERGGTESSSKACLSTLADTTTVGVRMLVSRKLVESLHRILS